MKNLMIALFCGAVSLSATAGGNATIGKEKAAKFNCASCHGADYKSPIDPSYPKLAGQHAEYLEFALRAYKRTDGMNLRQHAIMGPLAKQLSNEDMANIAAYLSTLPSDLVLKS